MRVPQVVEREPWEGKLKEASPCAEARTAEKRPRPGSPAQPRDKQIPDEEELE